MIIKEPEKFRNNIVNNLNTIIKNSNISQNLEKGIFNYSIQEAKKQKIIRKWNNSYFVRIYISKLHSLILNLKKNSYVKNSSLLKNTSSDDALKEKNTVSINKIFTKFFIFLFRA